MDIYLVVLTHKGNTMTLEQFAKPYTFLPQNTLIALLYKQHCRIQELTPEAKEVLAPPTKNYRHVGEARRTRTVHTDFNDDPTHRFTLEAVI